MELKKKTVFETDEASEIRVIYLFIDSQLYMVSGSWLWDLHTNELFCSDVMLALEKEELPAPRCIIYPEDLPTVYQLLEKCKERERVDASIRLITSHGKPITIRAFGYFECEKSEGFLDLLLQRSVKKYVQTRTRDEEWQKESLQLQGYRYVERLYRNGIWYLNTATHECYYSDEVFRIHGVPPQSLNTHLQ